MIVCVLNSEAYSEPVSLRFLCSGTIEMSVLDNRDAEVSFNVRVFSTICSII